MKTADGHSNTIGLNSPSALNSGDARHHLLEFLSVRGSDIGARAPEIRVMEGCESLLPQHRPDLFSQRPEHKLCRVEIRIVLERADHVHGVGEHAIVDGHDGDCVVDGVAAKGVVDVGLVVWVAIGEHLAAEGITAAVTAYGENA